MLDNLEGPVSNRTGIRFLWLLKLSASKLFDWGDEAIAVTGKRFNEARIVRRVIKGFAQPHDRSVQAVIKIDEGIIGPKSLAKFFARDDFASLFQQNCENPARLFLKFDLPTLLP